MPEQFRNRHLPIYHTFGFINLELLSPLNMEYERDGSYVIRYIICYMSYAQLFVDICTVHYFPPTLLLCLLLLPDKNPAELLVVRTLVLLLLVGMT